MKIFELKQKQAEALELLQWLTADEIEDIEAAKIILENVAGSVAKKLDYWLPLLHQAKFDHDQAVEAKRRYVAAHDANIKRKERVSEWIKEHVLSLMVDFGIEKHKGELFNCSHYLSTGSLQFGDTFDLDKLPDRFTKMTIEPDKKAITEALKEIDAGEVITKNDSLPGCYLVKKEILRVS
jgi:hypothetical protein